MPSAFCWSSLCSAGALLTPKQQLPCDFLGTEREVRLGLTVSPSLLCLGQGLPSMQQLQNSCYHKEAALRDNPGTALKPSFKAKQTWTSENTQENLSR